MENGSVFMYLSIIEGFMIVMMLGWEIFWLRRMYQVLWRMPTASQLDNMLNMIKDDKETLTKAIMTMVGAFEPLKHIFGNGIGSLFAGKGITKE